MKKSSFKRTDSVDTEDVPKQAEAPQEPTVALKASPLPVQTESVHDKIWKEVKDVKLDLFGLPDQFVSKFFEPVKVDPNRLFVKFKVGAALAALETAVGHRFDFDQSNNGYLVLTKKTK